MEKWAGDAVTRMVALPHTEGCGSSGGASEETFARIMLGYLLHPNTRMALLLEHGCEKTHNDYFRSRLVEAGADPSRFGWASIQADGGLDAVGDKVKDWFNSFDLDKPVEQRGNLGALTVGLEARGTLTDDDRRGAGPDRPRDRGLRRFRRTVVARCAARGRGLPLGRVRFGGRGRSDDRARAAARRSRAGT